ncbi:MAG: hypothetical protein JJU40_13300 [Rhodobacteraceae bacterium]|nr:hypothetical protein [Paracoccaceae bacterium]
MTILPHVLLAASLSVLGAFAAGSLGAQAHIPGAAPVVVSALVGAMLGLGLGILGALGMSLHRRRLVLALTGPLSVAVIGWGGWSVIEMQRPSTDPELAYLGLPDFHITLSQAAGLDPDVAAVEIDTDDRLWTTRLSDGRICRGVLRASVQDRLGTAMAAALPLPEQVVDICGPASGGEGVRLDWRKASGEDEIETGSAIVSAACRQAHPALDGLARTITLAPSLAVSRSICFQPVPVRANGLDSHGGEG